jgi:hypothetical protein
MKHESTHGQMGEGSDDFGLAFTELSWVIITNFHV